jgi:hypothetical protein
MSDVTQSLTGKIPNKIYSYYYYRRCKVSPDCERDIVGGVVTKITITSFSLWEIF